MRVKFLLEINVRNKWELNKCIYMEWMILLKYLISKNKYLISKNLTRNRSENNVIRPSK